MAQVGNCVDRLELDTVLRERYVAKVGRWLDRKGDTEIVRLRFGWIDILQTNI